MTHHVASGIRKKNAGQPRARRALPSVRTRRPRSLSGAIGVVSALALVGALLVTRTARAEAFDIGDTSWEGCSELLDVVRAELGTARVKPVGVLNWDEVKPEDGVLALHPMQPMDPDETAAFMKTGGRLAILDDYGAGDATLQRFRIYRVPAPSRPVSALRNRPALAIAEPVLDVVAGHASGPHPVVANVQRLVTNHATGLQHPSLSPVLKIRAIGEPDVMVAVAGQVDKGRLFAMSDPSAVINQMLRYPGNRAFLAGLARYLVDDDGPRKRQGNLFLVANRFREEGSVGGSGGSFRKDLEVQLRALANAISEARRDGLPRWMHFGFAMLVGLALATWVARASARPYRSPVPRYARPTALVSQGGVAGRFALLAAPSSPRSLALLELRSALFEAMALRFGRALEPSYDEVVDLAGRAGSLDGRALTALKGVLAVMQRVEASVVAGRPFRVRREAVSHAASVVREVLDACDADPAHKPVAVAPQPPFVDGAPIASTRELDGGDARA